MSTRNISNHNHQRRRMMMICSVLSLFNILLFASILYLIYNNDVDHVTWWASLPTSTSTTSTSSTTTILDKRSNNNGDDHESYSTTKINHNTHPNDSTSNNDGGRLKHKNNKTTRRRKRIQIIGHRGALYDNEYENTKAKNNNVNINIIPNSIQAFNLAIQQGADMIEMDLQLCSTGEIVIFHDLFFKIKVEKDNDEKTKETEGTTRGTLYDFKYLKDMTLEEIKDKMPFVPTLQEVLDGINGQQIIKDKNGDNIMQKKQIKLLLETKGDIAVVTTLMPILQTQIQQQTNEWSADQFIIQSFDDYDLMVVNYYRHKYYDELQNLKTISLVRGVPLGLAKKYQVMGVSAIAMHQDVLTNDIRKDAYRKNLDVYVYTVNDESIMKRMVDVYNVDGIITDYPGRLKSLLSSIDSEAEEEVDADTDTYADTNNQTYAKKTVAIEREYRIGDPIEILHGKEWYPGVILEVTKNDDDGLYTYTVMWWLDSTITGSSPPQTLNSVDNSTIRFIEYGDD